MAWHGWIRARVAGHSWGAACIGAVFVAATRHVWVMGPRLLSALILHSNRFFWKRSATVEPGARPVRVFACPPRVVRWRKSSCGNGAHHSTSRSRSRSSRTGSLFDHPHRWGGHCMAHASSRTCSRTLHSDPARELRLAAHGTYAPHAGLCRRSPSASSRTDTVRPAAKAVRNRVRSTSTTRRTACGLAAAAVSRGITFSP